MSHEKNETKNQDNTANTVQNSVPYSQQNLGNYGKFNYSVPSSGLDKKPTENTSLMNKGDDEPSRICIIS